MTKIIDALQKNKDLPNVLRGLDQLLTCGTISPAESAAISDMKKRKVEETITEVHGHKIYFSEKQNLYYTQNPADLKSKIRAKTKEKLYEKLYQFYYGKQTVEELYEPAQEWYSKCHGLTTESLLRYDFYFKKYITGTNLSTMEIINVKASDIAMFFASFAEKINRHDLANIKTIVNRIFDYAFENDIIDKNLARQYNTRSIKTKAENDDPYNVYTDIDRQKIVDRLLDSTDEYDRAISLMFCLCCRLGELRALHIEDINFTLKTVLIHSQIVKRDEDGRHWVEVPHTKTGHDDGVRAIPLSDRALDIIKKTIGNRTSGYIFRCNGQDKWLNDNTFRRHLKTVCEQAGIKYLPPHKIRFWAASALAKQGADLMTLMDMGGWADKNMAYHYVRRSSIDDRARNLSQAVFN